jgi:hypothetical protein
VKRGQALERTEAEIRAEKAAALGRAGERLEQALGEAAAIGARLDAAATPADHDRLLAEYERARQRVAQARLALIIQREAIGLRQHRLVDQQYPDPPRRHPRQP